MKHREIMNILILVGSAFLLVAILSYFNLYEGMEYGVYEGLDEKEGLEEEEEPVMDGFDNMPPAPDAAAAAGATTPAAAAGATTPAAAAGAATVLKFATF